MLNTEVADSTVGRLVGNGRLYVTGAGTISFIGESELDPGTRVDADGERDVSGNTWLAGNKLADILLGAGTVNVGSADGGATVVDNVFDGATSVSFLRSDASNATVAGASNGGMFVNGAADYLGDIEAPVVNIYGHQVFNNFQSLWTERTMLSAENSTIGSPVNQVYEPVRFSWRNPDGSVTRSTGTGASVWVQDGAVLTINQSYGRDGRFTGTLNSTGSGLVVKTGEGQFLYQGDGTLGHLRIEEGNWIAAGNSLSDCKVEVSGTGSLNLLVSNTGTFSGEVTALSRDATLLLSRSYTLINDLEEQPDTVLENADSLTENDYRTYGPGLDSQTAALQITNTQTLFYGTVSVTEGVTLILGEIVPKRIAMKNPEKISLAVSWFLYAIAAVSTPLIWFLTVSTNAVLRLIGINPNVENRKVTEEEVRIMIDACSEGGGIDDIEKKMLNNVFEFDDKRVRDVMTYRLDVAFLNADDPKEKWEKIMVKTRYSVYPVYRQNKDNVVGVITIKDYLKYKKLSEAEIIKKAVKPAQITIDTLHIDELFINMQKSRNHFAVVVDEYGSITGIVTMKDLLEELVGELGNDTVLPPEDPMVEKIDDHTWLIKGSASLKEVSAALKIKFPPNDCTTFAGLLFALMDNIPQNKKNVKLQYGRLKIKIPQIRARRIEEAIVRLSDN